LGGADEKPSAADTTDLKIEQPVTMEGHAHRLYVVERQGQHVLMMASNNPDEALKKIDFALQDERIKADSEVSGRLTDAKSKIEQFIKDIFEYDHASPDEKKARAASGSLHAEVTNISLVLNIIGKALDITELAGTTDCTDEHGKILPTIDIRATFYGGSEYNKHRGAVLNKGHNFKRDREAELKEKFPAMWEQATFYCPGVEFGGTKIYPHLASDLDLEVDHIMPVTWHWRDFGRKIGQQAREEWYVELENLQALCGTCNGVKRSLGVLFDPQTEEGFVPPAKLRARRKK
jgi:hypothetical protein